MSQQRENSVTIEQNLNARIAELEQTLRDIRDGAAYNRAEPGNEDDTLESIIDQVTRVMHDDYEFDMAKFMEMMYGNDT
jgi:hypothetical protein